MTIPSVFLHSFTLSKPSFFVQLFFLVRSTASQIHLFSSLRAILYTSKWNYARYEVQVLWWVLWTISLNFSLHQPPLLMFSAMESVVKEWDWLTQLSRQEQKFCTGEICHAGCVSQLVRHHLNSILWIIMFVCHSYWQLLSDQSPSASSILATAQK